jgi:NAD(P)-dependent dehydrogenase (short-subunit alcohol dehydrogenase family)
MTPVATGALSGRTVLVIGGSSGIGYEVARQAGEAGASVTITGRDRRRLADAAESLGAEARQLDAHDEAQIEPVLADLSPVDHIVSMIGDSMAGGFLQTSPETMRHVLGSKFLANWAIGRHAARILAEDGSLTYTSGTGGRPHEVSATYVANLGIGALVQGLAVEMAPRHRVNAVAPTFMGTATAFWHDTPADELARQQAGFAASVPLRRTATTSEVAGAYLLLMASTFITGQTLAVDGGVILAR